MLSSNTSWADIRSSLSINHGLGGSHSISLNCRLLILGQLVLSIIYAWLITLSQITIRPIQFKRMIFVVFVITIKTYLTTYVSWLLSFCGSFLWSSWSLSWSVIHSDDWNVIHHVNWTKTTLSEHELDICICRVSREWRIYEFTSTSVRHDMYTDKRFCMKTKFKKQGFQHQMTKAYKMMFWVHDLPIEPKTLSTYVGCKKIRWNICKLVEKYDRYKGTQNQMSERQKSRACCVCWCCITVRTLSPHWKYVINAKVD